MRNLFLKLSGFAIALTLLITTGCGEDDPIGGGTTLGPEISFNSGVGLTSADATLAPGETFAVELSALPGDNPLQTFTFLVDGVAPDAASIGDYFNDFTLNGTAETPNNPAGLFGSFKDGATIGIEIVPFGQVDGTIVTYSFEIADEVGETAIVSLDIEIVDPATPIDTTLTGLLLSQAGPAGTGGLDLDTGEGTGSSDSDAEIQDEGINEDFPQSTSANWRRQISSANNAQIRQADLNALPENFSFDNVTSKEAIEEVFNTGTALDGDDSACNCTDSTTGEAVSEQLNGGEVFAVLRDGRYYLIRIDDVVLVYTGQDNQPGNNDDYYEISVKY
jgi:hypothetical protein